MITDAETGEWTQNSSMAMGFDHETGEIWDYRALSNPPSRLTSTSNRNEFHVPQSYLREIESSGRKENGQSPTAQHEITLGYRTTHKLFLVPSLFLFFKITALVLLFCELVLHIWAHKKNSRNTDPSVFYRSPLHLISGQFCASCTNDVGMIKLERIQDKRRKAKQLMGFSGSGS